MTPESSTKHTLPTAAGPPSFPSRSAMLLLALATLLACGDNTTRAQDTTTIQENVTAPAQQAATTNPPPEARSLWKLLREGGWIMLPLGVISLWSLSLIIEGFVRIRRSQFMPADVLPALRQACREENYQQAWRICCAKRSFLTDSLRPALECIGRGRAACETALNEHVEMEIMAHRTRVSYLSTIGVISPMVGLLGTVTGMIRAFGALGTTGINNPHLLAAAIGEVLIATATGLIVAIPAFFMYYFFRNRLQLVTALALDEIRRLMRDVRFDELQGVRIGEELEAELAASGPPEGGMPETTQPCVDAAASTA